VGWKPVNMFATGYHTSAMTADIDEDAGSDQPSRLSSRDAFTRAAREMRVPVEQLERLLPDWARRPDEQVDYEVFHQVIRGRIVEILRVDA